MRLLNALLKYCFYILAVSAMLIGGSNFLFGIAITGSVFDTTLQSAGLMPSSLGDFSTASVDSEFRFYSVFWFAYGAMLWRTAARLGTELKLAGWLIALFGFGGIGRLISYLAYGPPAPLFLFLTWVEVVLSVLMLIIWILLFQQSRAVLASSSPESGS